MLGIRTKLLIFGAASWIIIFGIYGVYTYFEKIEKVERHGVKASAMLSDQFIEQRKIHAEQSEDAKKAFVSKHIPKTGDQAGITQFHTTHIKAPDDGGLMKEIYYIDTISPKPERKDKEPQPVNKKKGPQSAFQEEALKAITSGERLPVQRLLTDPNGIRSIHYVVADIATSESCVNCHNEYLSESKYRLGDIMGAIEVIVPVESEMKSAMREIRRSVAYGLAVIVVMGIAGFAFLGKIVTGRITGLAEIFRHIAGGDLTKEAVVGSTDEIGELADGTNEMLHSLHAMINGVRSASDDAVEIAAGVRELSRHVVEGSYTQASRLDTITSAMEKINSSITEIARGVTMLASSVETGSSTVRKNTANFSEAADNLQVIFSEINDSSSSTGQLNTSIKIVNEGIDNIALSIRQVSESIQDINSKASEIEADAALSSGIAEEVIEDARRGMASVEKTMNGMERTITATRDASEAIKSLSERILEIERILDVIRNISEETNLLAMNAAIIATRAGESGKSFSVVAGEITELAERAGNSTKEVSKIIEAVQLESFKAVEAMDKGLVSVEEGSALSMAASEALGKLVESAELSTERVRMIASVASYQAKEGRLSVGTLRKIADTATQIVKATHEQTKKSEHLNSAGLRMKDTSLRVKELLREQVDSNKKISMTMEDLNSMVSHVNTAIHEQSQGSGRILQSIEDVRNVSVKNIDKARETEEAVEALAALNKSLMESVRRFKLKDDQDGGRG